jgi:hypothetical protein
MRILPPVALVVKLDDRSEQAQDDEGQEDRKRVHAYRMAGKPG